MPTSPATAHRVPVRMTGIAVLGGMPAPRGALADHGSALPKQVRAMCRRSRGRFAGCRWFGGERGRQTGSAEPCSAGCLHRAVRSPTMGRRYQSRFERCAGGSAGNVDGRLVAPSRARRDACTARCARRPWVGASRFARCAGDHAAGSPGAGDAGPPRAGHVTTSPRSFTMAQAPAP